MKGADVLAAIESFFQSERREVGVIDGQINDIDQQIQTRLAEKTEAIVELAAHYLPAIDQEAVRRNHRDVRAQLENVLARKNRELRLLTEQLSELRPQLDRADAKITDLSQRLQTSREARESGLEKLNRLIQQDEEIQSLAERAVAAGERLAQNEIRLDEIRREAEEKLPAYESSSLFLYLHDRHYGEQNYAGRGVIRRLDRWVARLIDFGRAKKGFEFLRLTPETMSAEIAKRKKASVRLCNEIERRRDALKTEWGIADIESRNAELETQYNAAMDESEARQNQIEPIEEEFGRIESSQGPYYEEVLEQLVEFLSQTRTNVLKQWAEQTLQPEDDEIVAQIQWLSDRTRQLQEEAPRLQTQRRRLANRVRQMQYVIRSCRRSEIDSARCSFPAEFDIASMLDRYRDERIDQHELLRRVREHREFAPSAGERAAKRVTEVLDHPSVQTIMQVVAAATGQVLRQLLMPRRR